MGLGAGALGVVGGGGTGGVGGGIVAAPPVLGEIVAGGGGTGGVGGRCVVDVGMLSDALLVCSDCPHWPQNRADPAL